MKIERMTQIFSDRIRQRQLSIFMAIYECQNIVAASKKISLTQSTLSKSLTSMEKTIEQKLFVRLPRGVKPTLAGDVLYRYAKLLLVHNKQVAKEMVRLISPDAGQITIACSAVWDSFLARTISAFKSSHPNILVRIQIKNDIDLINSLQRAEADIIFSRLFPEWQSPALIQEPVFLDPNAFIVAPNHPELEKLNLRLEDLMDYPWVMPFPNAMIRRIWDQMFFNQGLSLPENVIECSSMLTARALLLEIENVITMPPLSVFRNELQQGLFSQLDLQLLDTKIPVGFTYRKDSRNNDTILEFKNIIHDIAQT